MPWAASAAARRTGRPSTRTERPRSPVEEVLDVLRVPLAGALRGTVVLRTVLLALAPLAAAAASLRLALLLLLLLLVLLLTLALALLLLLLLAAVATASAT